MSSLNFSQLVYKNSDTEINSHISFGKPEFTYSKVSQENITLSNEQKA